MSANSGSGKANEIKIILLGESGVGKTSIINRYVNNKFLSDSGTTLSASYSTKELVKNKTLYSLKLWDTTGQEKYHSITSIFIKGSNIVILVYSVDLYSSFEKLEYWYNNIKEILQEDNYVLAVVGNKTDLIKDEEETVPEEEARNYAKEKNAQFKLVSCKEDPVGINNLFDTLLEELIKLNCTTENNNSKIKKKNLTEGKKKKCC